MARQIQARTPKPESSHASMISNPRELAGAIEDAIAGLER